MSIHSAIVLPRMQKIAAFAGYLSLITLGFFLPLSITGITITFGLTAVFVILSGQIKTQWRFLCRNPVVWAAVLLFILLLISISYSAGTWADINQALGKYQKLLYLLLLMPLFSNFRSKKAGINAFLAAMLITLSASFLKKWGLIHLGNGGLSTLFTNHINTSFFMAFAAFLLAHRCWTADKFRWLYGIWLLLTCYQLFFMNEGRTGYFIFMALFALFLWQKFNWRGLLAAILLMPLLFGLVWFTSSDFRNHIGMIHTDIHHYQKKELEGNSVGLRMQFTRHSVELIEKHPWLGTGVGSYRLEYSKNFPPDPGFANMDNPQNEFLMIGVQLGVLGLLILLALFYLQWYYSFALTAEMQPLAQGMVLAFIVGCWSDTFLYLGYTGYFFVYFTALFYSFSTEKLTASD